MTGTISPELPEAKEPRGTSDSRVKSSLITLRNGLNAILNGENKVNGEEIAKGTISEAPLADKAITSRKVKITEGEAIYTGGESWLGGSGSPSNFVEPEIVLATASIVHIQGVFYCGQRSGNGSADQVVADIYLDGFAQGRGRTVGWEQTPTIPGIFQTSIFLGARFALAAGTHHVSLRAYCTNGAAAGFAPSALRWQVFSQ